MKHLVFVLSLAVVAMACAPAAAAAETSLKDRVPGEAYGCATVRNVPDLIEKFKATPFHKGVVDSGILRMFEASPYAGEAIDFWRTYIAPVGTVLRGEVTMAILPPAEGEDEVGGIAAAAIDEAAYEAYMESAIGPVLESSDAVVEDLDVDGLSMLRIALDPDDPDDAMVLCASDGVLAFSQSTAVVEAFMRGKPAAPLTASDGYRAFSRVAAESDVECYLDAAHIVRDVLGHADAEPKAVIEGLGLDDLLWAGWAMWIEPEGTRSTLRVESSQPPGGLLRACRPTGDALRSARLVPADADAYFALKVTSFSELYAGLAETIAAAKGVSAEDIAAEMDTPAVQDALGMSLRDDLLPALGSELAVAVKAPAQDRLGRMPEVVVLVQVRNEATVAGLMQRLTEMVAKALPEEAAPTKSMHNGVAIISVPVRPGVSMAYAFKDGFLVLGMSRASVARVLDTAPEASLAEAEAFQSVLERVGGAGALTAYGDYVGFGKALFSAGIALDPDGPRSGKMMLSMLWVKSEGVTARFGHAFSVDAHGGTVRAYSETGPFNPLGAIGAGMVLPAVARARSQARIVASMSNERQIALALMAYSADHDDMLPDRLSELVEGNYISGMSAFVHPAGTNPRLLDPDKPETIDEHSDYELMLGGVDLDTLSGENFSEIVLLREKRQFTKGGRAVCYLDGHVVFVPGEPQAPEKEGVDEDAGDGPGTDAAIQCPECGSTFVPDGSDPDRIVCPECGSVIKKPE